MSRCLVTGGAGFIGSHLTERLLAAGHEVVIIDNLSTGRRQNLAGIESHPRLTIVEASIADHQAVSAAARDAEVIYHLAAAVGVKLVADDPVLTIETNIYPTEYLLRLALQGQRKFFLASTSEVYGKNPNERWTEEDDLQLGPTSRPRWAYGCSKAIDEFLALAYHRKYGLPVVIGRFFNVIGPRQIGSYGMVVPRFIEQALSGGPVIVYDDGSQERCFADVREVVACIEGLMETPEASGEIFNIGSDQPISVLRLAQEVVRRANPMAPITHIPYSEAYGRDFEDVQRRVPDVSKLARTLGRKPSKEVTEILEELIEWKRRSTTPDQR